ncbi:MAG: hypothetical protein ACYTGB_05040, partial [Planctomycetota bacterium]
MRTKTSLLACLLGLLIAPAARAGDGPDFEAGRAVETDFDLELRLGAELKDRLTVGIGRAEEHAYVRFGPGRAVLLGARTGAGAPAEQEARLPAPAGGTGPLCVVKLRTTGARHLALVAAGRELARLQLPPMKGPFRLAFAGAGGVKVVGLQKIDRSDPVLFTDGFTRRRAELGVWKTASSGAWRISADPHPETSASPFALEAVRAASPTRIGAGEEFWDDYLARASVCVLSSPGAAGLAFNLTSRGGYLLRLRLRGRGSGGAGAAELVRLGVGGAEKVLASRP